MNYPQANRSWNPARKHHGLRGGPGLAPPPAGGGAMPGLMPMPMPPGMPPVPFPGGHNMHHVAMGGYGGGGLAGGPPPMPPPMPPPGGHMPPHIRHGPPMPPRKGLLGGGGGGRGGGERHGLLNSGPPPGAGGGMKGMSSSALHRPPPPTALAGMQPGNSFDVMQKRAVAMHAPIPDVAVERVGGQDHKPLFEATITWLPERFQRKGLGHSKMEAKRAAAAAMLTLLDLRDRRPAKFPSSGVYEDRQPEDHTTAAKPPGASAPADSARPAPREQGNNGQGPGWQANAQTTSAATAPAGPSAPQQDAPSAGGAPSSDQLNGLLNMMSQNPQFMQQLNSVKGSQSSGGLQAIAEPPPPAPNGGLSIPLSRPAVKPTASIHATMEKHAASASPTDADLKPASPAVPVKGAKVKAQAAPRATGAAASVAPAPAAPAPKPAPTPAPKPAPTPAPKPAPCGGAAARHSGSGAAAPEKKPVAEAGLPPKKKRMLAALAAAAPPSGAEKPETTPIVSNSVNAYQSSLAFTEGGNFSEMPGISIPRRKRTRPGDSSQMTVEAAPKPLQYAAAIEPPAQQPPASTALPAVPARQQESQRVTAVIFVNIDDGRAMAATVALAGTSAANALDLQVRAFGPFRTVETESDRLVPDWMNVTRETVSREVPYAVEMSLSFSAGRDAGVFEQQHLHHKTQSRILIVTTSVQYNQLALSGVIDVVAPERLLGHLESLDRL